MTESGRNLVLTNANLATMAGDQGLSIIEKGAFMVEAGRFTWVGKTSDLPREGRPEAPEYIDAKGGWVLPGFIDCHTHTVFAGSRISEYKQRLDGVSYSDISKAGGGIMASVRATRAAEEAVLVGLATGRLQKMRALGTRTVEIKSGYGLNLTGEAKCLSAARQAGKLAGVRVITTFLGAHALPPEFEGDADGYIDYLSAEVLPELHDRGLIDAVDGFMENIAFNANQIERLFDVAKGLGLPLKLHADQLSDGGGAALAARYGALSADHMEYSGPDAVAAMADAGTTAVLLPGAFYFLRETKKPPVEACRASGVPMAIATDLNPGTSPALSLPLIANMACTLFGLTSDEALRGITINGAQALGMADEIGSIEVGKRAEFNTFDISEPAELVYWIGSAPEPVD